MVRNDGIHYFYLLNMYVKYVPYICNKVKWNFKLHHTHIVSVMVSSMYVEIYGNIRLNDTNILICLYIIYMKYNIFYTDSKFYFK